MLSIFKKRKAIELKSPVKGRAIEIKDVPDEVFASGMLGNGIAIDPVEGIVYSPCDCEIVNMFPTKHAIGVKTNEGLEILIHIGIDTVEMKGEGFNSFVNIGDKVKAGDKLISFDLELVKSRAKSPITPMVITNMDFVESIEQYYGDCDASKTVLKAFLK
ncbi:PTS system IIA component, Glc family [Caloramator quimbayensis]|uniref:PTS system IIA component, Glc family n=2 Tax=Caloramator quimbayensis TaxID=1147123 RepID=A0A1T4WRC7_9CLOT|nr:PTS system IIA component, Glc family [Caloramator quimbayensis]